MARRAQVDVLTLHTPDKTKTMAGGTPEPESGYLHGVCFTDMGHSRRIFCHCVRTTADLCEALRAYVEEERRLGHIEDINNVNIQLECDSAFATKAFRNLLASYGMRPIEPCPPRDHNQIGSIEACNNHIRRTYLALMKDLNLPRVLDHHALRHAVWCINSMGCAATKWVPREKIHTGRETDLRGVQVFGTPCAVHVHRSNRAIDADRAQWMPYVGDGGSPHTGKFLNTETNHTMRERSFDAFDIAPQSGIDIAHTIQQLNASGVEERDRMRANNYTSARAATPSIATSAEQALAVTHVSAKQRQASILAAAEAKRRAKSSVPTSYPAAQKHEHCHVWETALKCEMNKMFETRPGQEQPTLRKIRARDRPPGAETNMSFLIYSAKFEGFVPTKAKVRLVLGGHTSKPFTQWHGTSTSSTHPNDYDGSATPETTTMPGGSYDAREVNSPVAYASTHRFLLCDAAFRGRVLRKYDVTGAFLNAAKLTGKRVFMWPPKGCSERDAQGFALIYEVLSNIYGMKTGARAWHIEHVRGLLSLFGLDSAWTVTQLKTDSCCFVFTKTDEDNKLIGDVIVSVHVDDGLVSATDDAIADEWLGAMRKKWAITDGPADHFLGCEILDYNDAATSRRIVALSQSAFIEELAAAFGVLGLPAVDNPLMAVKFEELFLGFAAEGSDDIEEMAIFPFRRLIGSLEHVVQCTRPDAARAVHLVATFQANPSRIAKKWALRILRYLATTAHETLRWWGPKAGHISPPRKLVVHCDADHASCPTSGRSYTGVTFTVDGSGSPYDWISERQTSVARDNNKAEAFALTRAMEDADGFHSSFLSEIGVDKHKALILSDSEPTVNKMTHFNSSTRTRNENVLLHNSREIARNGNVINGWLVTGENHTDALTKRMTTPILVKHRQVLLGVVTPWHSTSYFS